MPAKQNSAEVPATPDLTPIPYVADISQNPYFVTIFDHSTQAWNDAAVLIKNHGYVITKDFAPEFFAYNGMVRINLCLGSPEAVNVERAKEIMDRGMREQQSKYDNEVKQAAKALHEQWRKEEAAKEIERKRKEFEQALAKEQAAFEARTAEIARQAGIQ